MLPGQWRNSSKISSFSSNKKMPGKRLISWNYDSQYNPQISTVFRVSFHLPKSILRRPEDLSYVSPGASCDVFHLSIDRVTHFSNGCIALLDYSPTWKEPPLLQCRICKLFKKAKKPLGILMWLWLGTLSQYSWPGVNWHPRNQWNTRAVSAQPGCFTRWRE